MFVPTRRDDQGANLCCHGNDNCARRGVYNDLQLWIWACLSLDSAPSLGVYYFFVVDSVCMYVCMSVTLLQIDSSSLFIDGIEPFFGRQFFMWHSTKRCSSIFDLGPITPKIYSQKFGKKSPISRLLWQIDRSCLGLIGGFLGWLIQWNHT